MILATFSLAILFLPAIVLAQPESVVPVLTSNKGPSGGEAFASGSLIHRGTSLEPYMAFDGDESFSAWVSNILDDYVFIGYKFPTATLINGYYIRENTGRSTQERSPSQWQFQGSNDGAKWITLDSRTGVTAWRTADPPATEKFFSFENKIPYIRYRLFITDDNSNRTEARIVAIQISALKLFYSACFVPAMTSNKTPSGRALASGEYSSQYAAYNAFDHDIGPGSKYWVSNVFTPKAWVGYKFPAGVRPIVSLYSISDTTGSSTYGRTPRKWKLQGSNTGASWTTLHAMKNVTRWGAGPTAAVPPVRERTYAVSNSQGFNKYRLLILNDNDDRPNARIIATQIGEFKLCGRS